MMSVRGSYSLSHSLSQRSRRHGLLNNTEHLQDVSYDLLVDLRDMYLFLLLLLSIGLLAFTRLRLLRSLHPFLDLGSLPTSALFLLFTLLLFLLTS